MSVLPSVSGLLGFYPSPSLLPELNQQQWIRLHQNSIIYDEMNGTAMLRDRSSNERTCAFGREQSE